MPSMNVPEESNIVRRTPLARARGVLANFAGSLVDGSRTMPAQRLMLLATSPPCPAGNCVKYMVASVLTANWATRIGEAGFVRCQPAGIGNTRP
jgi:hypothetical protein